MTSEPIQENRTQKLNPLSNHPGMQGIRDGAAGYGRRRQARWPGVCRIGFRGSRGGQGCQLTPSGRNTFLPASTPWVSSLLVPGGLELTRLPHCPPGRGGLLVPTTWVCSSSVPRWGRFKDSALVPPCAQMGVPMVGVHASHPVGPLPLFQHTWPQGLSLSPHAHRHLGLQTNAMVCSGHISDP